MQQCIVVYLMTLQTSVIAHLIQNQKAKTSKREGWTFTFLCTLYIKC